MKNIYRSLLVFSAGIVLACGCDAAKKTDSRDEFLKISFDLTKMGSEGAPKMSDMVENIEYIKLGKAPGIPIISGVSCPFITDEHIFFLDHRVGILQYTRGGEFVRRIGSIGRGPGEFLRLDEIQVDLKAGTIYTMPSYENKVCKYDLATGKFIGETVVTMADGTPLTEYSIGGFQPFYEDDRPTTRGITSFASSQSNSTQGTKDLFSFAVLDLASAKIIHTQKSHVHNRIEKISWRDDEGRINVFETPVDTMYVINSDFSMTPRIVTDFGTMKPETDDIEDPGVSVLAITEGRRYMIFTAIIASYFKIIYFDKVTGESTTSWPFFNQGTYLSTGIENDFDGGFAHLGPYDENMGFAYFDAFDMKEALTPEHFDKVRGSVKYPEKLAELQALVASLNEDDNPVVAIAHLKK